MGTDYARATLPFAVRNVIDEENESLHDLVMAIHEHENNEATTSLDFVGWAYSYWDGEYKKDPNHLRDSINQNWHPFAWRLTKDDMQVWLVQEGHTDYDPFYSAGANSKEELKAFLQDIGRPDETLIERYVFFLIW